MASVLVFTIFGSWLSSLLPNAVLGGSSYIMTFIMGVRFLVSPITKTTSRMDEVEPKKRIIRSLLSGIHIGLFCGFVGAGGGVLLLITLRKAFLNAMFENGPSIAHRKLEEYERRGLLQGVITTNIDCLHTLAGSRNVAEIQGSFGFNKCLKCGQEYNDVQIWNQGKAPRCEKCGGVVGAFPVYKHIGLVEDEVRKARSFAAQAELVIIIGAQGSYGGIYYPYIRSGANIVQINPKATQFDAVAVLNIRKEADEVFCRLQ